MSVIPSLTLNTHDHMPLLGLGVYKATAPNEVETAIAAALDAGYRLIDTASVYKNEEGVGRAVKSSSIPREELFITTKVWNTAQRIGNIESAFERSLERLQMDYVDSVSGSLAGAGMLSGYLESTGKNLYFRKGKGHRRQQF